MMKESNIRLYMKQLCEALSFMHSGQPSIAHRFVLFILYGILSTLFRDVKPANLLLKSMDHLVLTDFGSAVMVPVEISNASESLTLNDEHAELCTMPYRAPELFTCEVGSVYDDSVDTWVILFN